MASCEEIDVENDNISLDVTNLEVGTNSTPEESCFQPLWVSNDSQKFSDTKLSSTDIRSLSGSQEDISGQDVQLRTGAQKRQRWTEEEKDLLLKCLKEYGQKWKRIAEVMKTRTALQVKNYAKLHLKHQVAPSDKEPSQTSHAVAESLEDMEKCVMTAQPTIIVQKRKSSPASGDVLQNVIPPKRPIVFDSLKANFPDSEIVSITKCTDDDYDEDVDVTDSGEEDLSLGSSLDEDTNDEDIESSSVNIQNSSGISSEKTEVEEMTEKCIGMASDSESNSSVNEITDQKTYVCEVPTQEIILDKDAVTEMEKQLHWDFFCGRPQKTPERYLKIRNHIVETWNKQKPVYLKKTACRNGLKNCGDVNCIGRIHDHLEQVGAINFGCTAQVVYGKVLLAPDPNKKNSTKKSPMKNSSVDGLGRNCKRKVNGGVFDVDVKGGGCTLEHSADGGVVSKTLIPSRNKIIRTRPDPFKLVPCRKFDDGEAPFSVKVSSCALVLMDIHAHLLQTEVIGLLGGYYHSEERELVVCTAEPCDSVSTGSECEMDSVSQTVAMEMLNTKGYDVVGWYHSHPTFVPNPSLRDLSTQADYQAMFSNQGRPFLAAILSPYLPHLEGMQMNSRTLASKVRWWIVESMVCEDLNEVRTVPYCFNMELQCCGESELTEVESQLLSLKSRFQDNEARVNLGDTLCVGSTVNCLEKMLSSLQHYLRTSGTSASEAARFLQNVHNMFNEVC